VWGEAHPKCSSEYIKLSSLSSLDSAHTCTRRTSEKRRRILTIDAGAAPDKAC